MSQVRGGRAVVELLKAEGVRYAIRAAFACSKPSVVEIPIDPEEFPTPAASVRR